MGKATNEAAHTLWLFPEQRMMQAVLIMANAGTDKYFQAHASYDGEYHIEVELFRLLNENTDNFRTIPNGCRLIVRAKWSPCKQCTEVSIPGFIKAAQLFERGVQLKFRFDEFYTRAHWEAQGGGIRQGGGQFFWESDVAATTAYKALCRKYGIHAMADAPVPAEERDRHRGITLMGMRTKDKLVIEPAGVGKTSRLDVFSVS
jgi:hypothetical protein